MWATLHRGTDVHAGKPRSAQEQNGFQEHALRSKRLNRLQGPLFTLLKQLALRAAPGLWSPACFPRPAQTAADPWAAWLLAQTRAPPHAASQLEEEASLLENTCFAGILQYQHWHVFVFSLLHWPPNQKQSYGMFGVLFLFFSFGGLSKHQDLR